MKRKNLSKKEKECAFGLLTFFIVALIVGVKSVYAYYYDDDTVNTQMIASYVGDFYTAQGDISIDVYKKFIDLDGTAVYKKVDAVPNESTGPATVTCTNPKSKSSVTCSTTDGDCKYTYSSGNFKLTSKTPVNCKVYFN